MHLLAALYLCALIAILTLGMRGLRIGWLSKTIALFLLIWAVFIVTAQILSLFSAINRTAEYIGLSIALAVAAAAGLRLIAPDTAIGFPEFPPVLSANHERYLAWFLIVTAGLVFAADLVLAFGQLPANPDSIAYRFPRVYWYFGQGSLMHFTNNAEPRPLYYPLNGTLAYIPLIHFQLGPRSFSGQSLLSWLMIGITTYAFARDLGGSRLMAGATAWVIMLTPNVLIQSLSTNDEIIAAAPLLAALYFMHRWYHGRQTFDAVLGVTGATISAGTKLHIVFYWPLIVTVMIAIAVQYRALVRELRTWMTVRRAFALAIMTVLGSVFSFSFIAYNYASAGRASPWEYNDQILNKPFDFHVALQNIALYFSQVVLTPVADLHIAFNVTQRAHYYEAFNRVFAPLFFWVKNNAEFTSAFYRFTGVISASAVAFNEQTIFIGFSWLVAIISGVWLSRRWKDARVGWARVHLASFPIWFVTYASMNRYLEGFTVYLSYATIIAAPAFVYAFAPIHSPRLNRLRWGLLMFVAAAHSFFALSILFTSSPRNLIALRHAPTWPLSRGFTVDQSVQDEIGLAKAGVYSHTIAWEQPHWAFMAYHPEIPQFLASIPNPIPVPGNAPDDPASVALRSSRYVLMPHAGEPYLHIYSFPQFTAYGNAIPIRVPEKPSPGLTWVGNLLFAVGPEWVFAAGNGVEARHPGRDKYIVLKFYEVSDFGRNAKPVLRMSPEMYGLGEKDNLAFRFELTIDGKLAAKTDWQPTPGAELATTGLNSDNGILRAYVRSGNAGGHVYWTEVALRSTKPLQLPDESARSTARSGDADSRAN
jgi:hypothetical protein